MKTIKNILLHFFVGMIQFKFFNKQKGIVVLRVVNFWKGLVKKML